MRVRAVRWRHPLVAADLERVHLVDVTGNPEPQQNRSSTMGLRHRCQKPVCQKFPEFLPVADTQIGKVTHAPEDAFSLSAVQPQHLLGQNCLDPGQFALRVAILLHEHDVMQCVAEHRRLEDRFLWSKKVFFSRYLSICAVLSLSAGMKKIFFLPSTHLCLFNFLKCWFVESFLWSSLTNSV